MRKTTDWYDLSPRWYWRSGNPRRDTWWRSSRRPPRHSCPSVAHEAARKYWAEPRDAPSRRDSPPSTCTRRRPPPALRLCSHGISRRRVPSRTGLSWICKQITAVLLTYLPTLSACYTRRSLADERITGNFFYRKWTTKLAKRKSILSTDRREKLLSFIDVRHLRVILSNTFFFFLQNLLSQNRDEEIQYMFPNMAQ